jgi:cytoskeletal protein CcmA (bactofilin family)
MSEASNGETVRVAGSGTHDRVDCERFRVDGSATVREGLFADRTRVNGSLDVQGPVEGGEVDADGSVSVEGAVAVDDLSVGGTATFERSVRAEHVSVGGSGTFDGSVSADHVDLDGSVEFGDNLDRHEIEGDGSTTVAGTLVAATASFDGSVSVEGLTDVTDLSVDGSGTFGDVSAETFVGEGAFDADAVTAGTFEFAVAGASSAEAVEGGDVAVTEGEAGTLTSLVRGLLGRDDPVLEVATVEGETVSLDVTRAGTVVGESVVLGADAEVDVVYTDDLDAADGATVGDVRSYDDF